LIDEFTVASSDSRVLVGWKHDSSSALAVADATTSGRRLQGKNLAEKLWPARQVVAVEELNKSPPCLIQTPLPGCAWTTVDLGESTLTGDGFLLESVSANICRASVDPRPTITISMEGISWLQQRKRNRFRKQPWPVVDGK